MKYYDKLIFELSKQGRTGYSLPQTFSKCKGTDAIPAGLLRSKAPELPEVSEVDVVRHYTNLSQMNFGVDTGFYPLGSCTMKYNPKINEEIAAMPAFAGIHPMQKDVPGVDAIYKGIDEALAAITGMKQVNDLCYQRAHYLYDKLISTGQFEPVFKDTVFLKEFVLKSKVPVAQVQKKLADAGFFGALETEDGYVSFCVTEKRSYEEVDLLIRTLG